MKPALALLCCQLLLPSYIPSPAPTGPAGGDLSGSYPNPGVAQLHGGAFPLSAAVMGSNGSSQPIAATTSGSGSVMLANNPPGAWLIYSASVSHSGTFFLPIVGAGTKNVTEANVQVGAPAAAVLANLSIVLVAAPGAGTSSQFIIDRNGVNTSITCTIANSATTCTDNVDSQSIVAGDLLSIEILNSGGAFTTGTTIAIMARTT